MSRGSKITSWVYAITKQYILEKLKQLKPKYEFEGLIILGLFGSYAKGNATNSSDIDILYKVDAKKFYENHSGFKCFSRILEIKDKISK